MQKLTNKEEEVMQILWKLEKAFVKDVLAEIYKNIVSPSYDGKTFNDGLWIMHIHNNYVVY